MMMCFTTAEIVSCGNRALLFSLWCSCLWQQREAFRGVAKASQHPRLHRVLSALLTSGSAASWRRICLARRGDVKTSREFAVGLLVVRLPVVFGGTSLAPPLRCILGAFAPAGLGVLDFKRHPTSSTGSPAAGRACDRQM